MSKPVEVFYCNAHEDQEMMALLNKYLTPLQKLGQITIWSEAYLSTGAEWGKELHRHLESADLILLLISPDFLASEYCYDVEMKRAIERYEQGSAITIPILLRPTYTKNMPFASLQMLPSNGLPISKWPDPDDAFLDILQAIEPIIANLQSR
jgi:hypothetical protein